jgi:hypothetical protein
MLQKDNCKCELPERSQSKTSSPTYTTPVFSNNIATTKLYWQQPSNATIHHDACTVPQNSVNYFLLLQEMANESRILAIPLKFTRRAGTYN